MQVGQYNPGAAAAGSGVVAVAYQNRKLLMKLAKQAANMGKAWQSNKRQKTSNKKKEYKKPTRKQATVLPKGDEVGTYTVSSRHRSKKRKQKTVKQEIKALKKRLGSLPSKSIKVVKLTTPIRLKNTVEANYVSVFFMRINRQTDIFAQCQDVFDIDYTDTKSSIRVSQLYTQIRLANNTNTNVKVSYQFVRCSDDDNEGYLANVVEYGNDREDWQTGVSAPIIVPRSGANINSAEIPENMLLDIDSGHHNTKFFGVHTNKFTPIGDVVKARIGPSDTMKIARTFPSQIFKPEDIFNEANTYRNKDLYILFKLEGDLVQRTGGTGTDLVGFSPAALIGSRFISYSLSTFDGQGQRLNDYRSDTDRTNLTTFGQIVEDGPAFQNYQDAN